MLCYQNPLTCGAGIKVFKPMGANGNPRESGIAGYNK
ncbi:hypothetical protein LMG26858_03633 [Achromobacter anxifer]|uniref:Uncharacterized protein n=1 Tax=Achromobacter anxifer TaxID=1287737 RepID=A0A6S7DFP9_9BURK|nr:hypothetical protein LMG26858_03633 [Achromobacter anxifer]CAB5513365.1 hypothetical protein LMG26857_02645 [Achromobacter anxifer]